MNEILTFVCTDCDPNSAWTIQYHAIRAITISNHPMWEIIDQRQPITESIPEKGGSTILNHHNTAKKGKTKHGHFNIYDSQSKQVGVLRASNNSQIISNEF